MGDGVPVIGKRGPGRPRKHPIPDSGEIGGAEIRDPGEAEREFDLGDLGEGNSGSTEGSGKAGGSEGPASGRKRGRPKKTDRLDLDTFASAIGLFHATVAIATQYRGFELTDDEANQLAFHCHKMMEHYGKSVSGETSLWIGFIVAIMTIEGPRIWGFLSEKRMQKKQPQQTQQNPNVVSLRPGGEVPPIIDAFPTQG
jgi:hypothetical protein